MNNRYICLYCSVVLWDRVIYRRMQEASVLVSVNYVQICLVGNKKHIWAVFGQTTLILSFWVIYTLCGQSRTLEAA